MAEFPIYIDLSSFFTDFRSKCLIYVDTTIMKTIAEVESRIKKLFDVDVDVCLFNNTHYLPSMEDARVLKSCHDIKIEPVPCRQKKQNKRKIQEDVADNAEHEHEPSSESNDIQDDPERLSNTKAKKRKKRIACDDVRLESQTDTFQVSPTVVLENVADKVEVKKKKNSKRSNSDMSLISSKSFQDEENTLGMREKSAALNGISETYVSNLPSPKNVTESSPLKKGRTSKAEGSDKLSIEDKTDSVNETLSPNYTEPTESDIDSTSQLSKKGRKRKRKRPNKRNFEVVTTSDTAEVTPPQPVQPNYHFTKPLADKTKHIYFSEEDEAMCEETVRKEAVEENVTPIEKQFVEKASEVMFQKAAEETAPHETSEKEAVERVCSLDSSVSKKQTWPQSRRKRIDRASGGIGKILSMLKNDSPPVFERPKAVSNLASAQNLNVETNSASGTPNKGEQSQFVVPAVSPSNDTTETAATHPSNTGKNASTLKFIPRENGKVSFKILKMSPSYCPEVSATITALVEKFSPESEEVVLRLISGAEECVEPKGKFDLDESEPVDNVVPETITLKLGQLIEPTESS